ncbi:unnamed protein product [Paramecium sonneborni]|uniref:Phospholipid scramblase n=1 Tax=Paramecium sonneborni TaxID=65129 RepID=A0A8S1MCP4_9CILI|nr:unnamed protein product [Paramecium sonneborni]
MLTPLNTNDSIGQTNFYQMGDYTNSQSCLDKLGNQMGIFLQQKIELVYGMTGFNNPRVYNIFPGNDKGEQIQQNELFKCKEKSLSGAYLALGPPQRPFEIYAINYNSIDLTDQQILDNSNRVIFKIERKQASICCCCCLDRPCIEVHYLENGENKKLGQIIELCYCCRLGCNIFDFSNQLKYIIQESSYCQCNHANFDIKTPDGEVIAPMKKKIKNTWDDQTDNFKVVFPQNASKEDKALILAATIMFEYMYFSNTENLNPNQYNQNNFPI